jgi:hypothetical protein
MPLDVISSYYQDIVNNTNNTNNVTNHTNYFSDDAQNITSLKPYLYVLPTYLQTFWDEINILILLSSWLLLPLVASYNDSGEFTIMKRMLYALKDNLIVYISIIIPACILIIYLMVHDKISLKNMLDTLMAASNTWGLTLYIIYLGYGMVNVVKRYFQKINKESHIKILAADITKKHLKMYDTYDKLKETIDTVNLLTIPIYDQATDLGKYARIVNSKIPFAQQHTEYATHHRYADDADEYVSQDKLAKAHTKMLKNIRKYNQHKTNYERVLKKGIRYNNFLHQKMSKFKHVLYKYALPLYYCVAGIILAIVSIVLVWSEITDVFTNVNIDVYAIFVYFLLCLEQQPLYALCAQIILYGFIVCLLLIISSFTFYGVDSYGFSPLTTSKMKIRLIAPMCLNFLNVCKVKNTIFSQTIGKYTLLPIVEKFTLYYPLLLLLVCILAMCKLFDKIIKKFGLGNALYIAELNDENIAEGMNIIENESRTNNNERNQYEMTIIGIY